MASCQGAWRRCDHFSHLKSIFGLTNDLLYATGTALKHVIYSFHDQVVRAAADETPLTLAVLRDHIEKEISEEASLSPDAAAKV